MPNVYEPDWEDDPPEPQKFDVKGARVGLQAGSERLGATVYEVAPGQAVCPLHFHHANEEMLVVLAGSPTLRTLDSERRLEPGEVVAFPVGPRGTHRIDNHGDGPVRVLIVSEMNSPEVAEYPDSGKVLVRGIAPGRPSEPGMLRQIFRRGEGLDYYDGEV